MPSGYIHFSRKTTQNGTLTVCTGTLAGKPLPFLFNDCSAAITSSLNAKDVTGVIKKQCAPLPAGAIRVDFEVGIRGGEDAAINVR